MKYGDKLLLVLTDEQHRIAYYTEPFSLKKEGSLSNFGNALSIFRENAYDAVREIVRDVEVNERIKYISTNDLISALRARGIDVQYKT